MELLKKSDQANITIFDGNFVTNKPVYNGKKNVAPYSSIFYWSHSEALEDCEFPLHPHQGFEIMTFILEGKVNHYDTETKIWTSLHSGDFQAIQSNSGVSHSEKIEKGTKSFQLWFDPNFKTALQKPPTYKDYRAIDFTPTIENGITTLHYFGENSAAHTSTEGLSIKKMFLKENTSYPFSVKKEKVATVYLLKGSILVNHNFLTLNDAFRMDDTDAVTLECTTDAEIFVIETPKILNYAPIWN